MKKAIVITITTISVVLLAVGSYLIFKNRLYLNEGIYFRPIYGYLGYYSEDVIIEIDAIDTTKNKKLSMLEAGDKISFLTDKNVELPATIKSIYIEKSNYNEVRIFALVNISNTKVKIAKIVIEDNQYFIGDLTVETISDDNNEKLKIGLKFLRSFQGNKTSITIINNELVPIILSDILVNEQFLLGATYPIILDDKNEYVAEVETIFDSKKILDGIDIVVFKPIYIFTKNDLKYYRTNSLTTRIKGLLTAEKVIELVGDKK